MSEETKTAKAAKKPAPKAKKPAPFTMPQNPDREYGTTVYTIRTDSKEQAAKLVSECEFRLLQSGSNGFELCADKAAYDRYKGSA